MFHLEEGWNFLFTEDPGTSIIEKKDSPEGYMKVLITTDWYRPVINGVVTSVLNLERELRARGHEVRVLTVSRARSSWKEDNTWYYLASYPLDKIYPKARVTLQFHHAFIQELIDWKPDVIHSQCELNSFIFAKKIADKTKAPLVHTYHTVYEDYTHYFSLNEKIGKQAVRSFSRWILGKTQAVIVPTDKVRNLLVRYGVHQKISVVPTGISLERFDVQFSEQDREKLRERLGVPKGNQVMVTLGRLAQEKNVQELIEYVHRLKRPNFTYLIIGDGPYRPERQKLVKRLGEEKQILFTGMVTPAQTPYCYRLGDVFGSSSNSETQGLTYVEALACGLPAICRRDPCLDEVVFHGYNGYQYSNFQEFAEAVSRILDHPDRCQEMSEHSFAIAEKYSSKLFARRVEHVYKAVIAKAERKKQRKKKL